MERQNNVKDLAMNRIEFGDPDLTYAITKHVHTVGDEMRTIIELA